MDPGYLDSLVKRGVISDDAAARMMDSQPQRQSRFDILRQGLDAAKDYLTPGYFRDTPSSPQADRALADPDARPGKIGPPSGPPTGMQIAGGLAGDVGLNALPGGKLFLGMANPTPRIVGPVKAMVDEMIARGASKNAIAEAAGTGTATIGRYLAKSGQKTAAAENPYRGVLGDLGNDEVIKAGLAQGDSYETIARRIGAQYSSVYDRALRDAGELSDIQFRSSNESKALLADPEKRADLIRLAKEGTSHGDIASYFFGGPGGKHPRRGEISRFIRQLQEEGEPELQNYTPQSGTGLTPAGRTPTVVQTKTQARPLPSAEDLKYGQDFARALSAFTQSR